MNPPDECVRVASVLRYTPDEGAVRASLDNACRLATTLTGRPMAAVELVLADEVRILAAIGLARGRVPRLHSSAARVLGATDLVVIPDAGADPRLAEVSAAGLLSRHLSWGGAAAAVARCVARRRGPGAQPRR